MIELKLCKELNFSSLFCLFIFEAFRYSAYLKVALKRGKLWFKSKWDYSHEISKIWNFPFLIALWYAVLYILKSQTFWFFCCFSTYSCNSVNVINGYRISIKRNLKCVTYLRTALIWGPEFIRRKTVTKYQYLYKYTKTELRVY